MKKGIVFLDWDGTLSHGRFWSEWNEEVYQKIQQHLFKQQGGLVEEWMRGNRSSESVCDWLEKTVGCGSSDLLHALMKSCERMTLSNAIIRRISEIKEERFIVLVTDNMDCFSRFTVPTHGLETIFDRVVNSADIKRLKCDQDGLSFREIAQECGIPLKECVLIDDSQTNCVLFRKMGGLAHQTSGVQHTIEFLDTLH